LIAFTSMNPCAPKRALPNSSQSPNLVGLTRDKLTAQLQSLGVPESALKMRMGQVWHWLYHRGVRSFDDMTNVSKDLRALLCSSARIGRPEVIREQISKDGTRKWLLRFDDGEEVETVFIPEDDRGTLCVSSQVGCTLNCTFCHTGTQKLVRNLGPAEIVGQLLVARDALGEWPSPPDGRLVSNIVLMGMGEPMYNFDNVAEAVKIMMDGEGLSLSKRRITLSTAGVVPIMARCGDELGVNLAVSLHAVTDQVRDQIVPLNRKYPIAELMAACRAYPGLNNARRITFEYIMLKGINDSDEDARKLIKLLKDCPAKVNLIPFNPWPGVAYESSDPDTIKHFSDMVYAAGISAPVRKTRGQDIMAACGQLKSDSVRLSRADRDRAAATANP
jgi:23S rRNA (adenine2503-C2)-methyltransferase